MKTTLRYLIIGAILGGLACLAFAVFGCAKVRAPKIPAPITAAIDCALPSLWNAVTVDSVERDVIAAVQQHDPIAALEQLAETAGEAEVTCVAAKQNSTLKLAILSIDGGVVKSAQAQWLDHEAAKGLYVSNFSALGN